MRETDDSFSLSETAASGKWVALLVNLVARGLNAHIYTEEENVHVSMSKELRQRYDSPAASSFLYGNKPSVVAAMGSVDERSPESQVPRTRDSEHTCPGNLKHLRWLK